MPAGAELGFIQMPRSWLKPALAVQRSALAETIARVLAVGVTLRLRLVASMSCQTVPSLFGSEYCDWLDAVIRAGGIAIEAGVTELEVAAEPVPTELVAATVNQYVVPLIRPLN